MTDIAGNPWLVAGGVLSVAAALAHLACIAGGPDWFSAMGAGDRMARMVEAGDLRPIVATVAIAGVLGAFGAYALSGAGVLPRLPLLRVVLVAATALYLLRGAVLVWPAALRRPDLSRRFITWSSGIVLIFGVVYLIGTWRGWADLGGSF